MKKFYTAVLMCFALECFAQTDILDARMNFDLGQEVTVTGICINGPELGATTRYIQDGTAGIALFPGGTGWGSFDTPQPGDEVTVTGFLSQFNGLLEVGPDISDVTINSTGNPIPSPDLVTPAQINETTESELITIENVLFENGGTSIVGNTTYGFTSDGEDGVIYVRNGSVLIGALLPASPITLIGIGAQFDAVDPYDTGYQVLPRTASDFVLSSSINIIGAVQQGSIEYSTIELFWTTDTPGDSKVYWGETGALGNEEYNAANTTSHTITISGLEPGTIYWAQVESSNGDDIASSTVLPYGTRSESTGTMTAYFTGSVDNSVAIIENAVSLGAAINDTIAAYIDRVDSTLDIAMYNFGDPVIRQAINDAYDRDVRIRYIGEGENTNAQVDDLDDNIPVLMRDDDFGSGMHNKFFIADVNLVDQAIVMSGSLNWIDQDIEDDFNNIIFIQDQTLARAYELEFEEMWGTDGDLPDEENSKFGADKVINTPKKFWIGNSPVELYFSPSDNANSAIIQAIQTTDETFDYALFAFTRDDIAQTIIDEDDLFLTVVHGIIEQTTDPTSVYSDLLAAGMDVFSSEDVPGLLHHKYAIVDQGNSAIDPLLINGSHNWSTSANTVNDENTLVIHDQRIANIFYQEFNARWLTVGVNEIYTGDLEIFPNPATSYIIVGVPTGMADAASVRIVDVSGRIVKQEMITNNREVISLDYSPGVYFVVLESKGTLLREKIVIR